LVSLANWFLDTKNAFDTVCGRANDLFHPTIRLGVTGLSQAGKTVFITALVHNLLESSRLPLFTAARQGRIRRIAIDQQPDATIPRFDYETSIDALCNDRQWPQSTSNLSQLKISFYFDPQKTINKVFNRKKFTLELIDYPGEWLLDLPLLDKSFQYFSKKAIAVARTFDQVPEAADFLATIHAINVHDHIDERTVKHLTLTYLNYIRAQRASEQSTTLFAPGRFLMAGDYEGAPALTFCPLPNLNDKIKPNTLAGLMQSRFEAYKKHIVQPFFQNYIATLDRQIILIDALTAINGGGKSTTLLRENLAEILSCFKIGRKSWLNQLFNHRISRILVAATKADQIHHSSQDRLQRLTSQLIESTTNRAQLDPKSLAGLAIAAIRTTREATGKNNDVPFIIGTPMAGEELDGNYFDGNTEAAIFPGDLPDNLQEALDASRSGNLKFIRFRPPNGLREKPLPHIRLDRAIDFLIGDYLQ